MRLVVSTTTRDTAQQLAKILVEERLAACVNIIPKLTSVYIWEGKLQEDEEALLLVKTTSAGVERLCTRLRELHSYDVPEIITLNVNKNEGNPDYLRWVAEQVASG